MKKIHATKLRTDQKTILNFKQKFKSKMPLVRCTCGAKILLVPDLAAMNRAIKNHLTEHKKANEQFLIEQIFKLASKQTLP